MREVLTAIGLVFLAPIVVFLCVKFGTIGFYKAKELIEKEKEV